MKQEVKREELSFDLGKKRAEGDRRAVEVMMALIRNGNTGLKVSISDGVLKISYIKMEQRKE